MAQITNQATLTYNGGTVVSNVATGELTEVLTVTKSAVPETYGAGDTVTYIVNILNSGINPVTGVSVSDDLGGYAFGDETVYPLTYVEGTARLFENGEPSPDPAVTPGEPVVFGGITVPALGNVTLIYIAQTNEYAPLGGGGIVNTATVDAPGITPAASSATVTPEEGVFLSISKSISPKTVKQTGNVTYTFVVRNYGPAAADAAQNVKITDEMNPVLTSLSASMNGAPMAETTDYSYSEDTGVFETVAGVVTVPAATFTQDPESGAWRVTPGETTLTVSGNLS